MELVSFQNMLQHAREHHYAIGAFNVLNMETMQAVTAANEAAEVPVIVQIYHAHIDYAGVDYLVKMGQAAAARVSTPVCLSLDHGRSFEQANRCIEGGFTGVMIDLASSDYEENVKTTRRVVEKAHDRGVSVEAELGKIFDATSPIEIRNSAMTDPEIAARFVEDTGVDALAVSIGTAHGFYSSKPQIDFARLERILSIVDCPIVVHGGSNTPDEDIKEIVRLGVSKLNIGTDLMAAFEEGMREAMGNGGYVDLQQVLESGRKRTQAVCAQKISILTAYKI